MAIQNQPGSCPPEIQAVGASENVDRPLRYELLMREFRVELCPTRPGAEDPWKLLRNESRNALVTHGMRRSNGDASIAFDIDGS